MIEEDITKDFQQKVCAEIRLFSEGIDRFRVSTPFTWDDGDHLVIILKLVNSGWKLTDEGHTYMHLTYDIDENDLHRGTRNTIINNVLSAYGVEDMEGELISQVREGEFGNALYSYIQALLKLSDLTFLTRERVRSTFMEDFRELISETVPPERYGFYWHHPQFDSQKIYTVDCRINGDVNPLFVYALPNDDRTRDATIALLQFEKWRLSFRSLAIFENQENINRKVLARFSDVGDKQFSSLSGTNRERIKRYISNSTE